MPVRRCYTPVADKKTWNRPLTQTYFIHHAVIYATKLVGR